MRILPHTLKIKALKPRETDVVLWVVKEKSELPTLFPLVESIVKITAQGVTKRAERMERSIVEFVKILNLLEEFPLLGTGNGPRGLGFNENPYEDAEEIQIALGRRQGKRVDLEVRRFKSYVEV